MYITFRCEYVFRVFRMFSDAAQLNDTRDATLSHVIWAQFGSRHMFSVKS